ncbi:four helix bundle protein [uncultured Prevotella sp.]|uniref:four helix bundle protein n=1 Tax=uncultured Prevotella sp. TaxID=159272 RepID=UPI0025E58D76|nr:four helix bundle protein [uncultured Prevotella sp.]
MSDFGHLLEDKCMNFSIRIIGLCRFLNEEKHEYRIADQMFRSGTSIGANIAEAQCAISKKDFIAKLYISLKESNETLYWLRLLQRTQYITNKQYESVYKDCEELKRMLVSIKKKMTMADNIQDCSQQFKID